MKKIPCKTFLMATVLFAALLTTACKSKDDKTTGADTTSTMMQPQQDNATVKPDTAAPVVISPDDSLTTMAKDAVKDYPGVTATVSNGEITLTGDIKRDKLPKLMMAVQATHPKKVNNNLTVK